MKQAETVSPKSVDYVWCTGVYAAVWKKQRFSAAVGGCFCMPDEGMHPKQQAEGAVEIPGTHIMSGSRKAFVRYHGHLPDQKTAFGK